MNDSSGEGPVLLLTLNSTFSLHNYTSPPLDTLHKVSLALQIVSLVTSLTIPAAYVVARKYSPDLANRLGFQLTVFLSFAEAACSTSQISGNLIHFVSRPTSNQDLLSCKVLVAADLFFCLWSTTLAFLIGYNLLRVFVYNEKLRDKLLLPIYLVGSVIWSAAFALPAVFLNFYSFDETQGACWFTPLRYSWLFYTPLFVTIAASCIVTFRVVNKLRSSQQNNPYFNNIVTSTGGWNPFKGGFRRSNQEFIQFQQRQAYEIIEMLVVRLIWYPIIPLVCQLPVFISDVTYCIIGTRPFWMTVVAEVSSSIEGILVFSVFFIVDPCWNKLKRDLRSKGAVGFETSGLPPSPASSERRRQQSPRFMEFGSNDESTLENDLPSPYAYARAISNNSNF